MCVCGVTEVSLPAVDRKRNKKKRPRVRLIRPIKRKEMSLADKRHERRAHYSEGIRMGSGV